MKINISIASIVLSILTLGMFTACSEDYEFKEVDVTGVKTLLAPEADKAIVLESAPTASVKFEWDKATAQDQGVVYYDVLFDVESGDFSKPIYEVVADNKGIATSVTISHRDLNTIASLAGIESSATGNMKWAIRASRGLTETLSTETRKLTITRLNGITPPAALYLTGEGAECGTDISDAMQFIASTPDEFVVFAELTAGKEFKYIDKKEGNVGNTYYSSGGQLKLGDSGTTVSETGIYRITLDFISGSSVIEKIDKVDFYMCTPQKRDEMTYQGNGVWNIESIKPAGLSGDDRYIYHMYIDGVEYKVGSKNWDNQPPAELSGDYFNIGFFGIEEDNWGYSFKFPSEMRNAPEGTVIVDMILYLNGSKYTNEIVKRY